LPCISISPARQFRAAQGRFEERQPVVAPEHPLAEEEGGHAESAALLGLVDQRLVARPRLRTIEITAKPALFQPQPRGQARDRRGVENAALDEGEMQQEPAACHQRPLVIRSKTGQCRKGRIGRQGGFAERDPVEGGPALRVVFTVGPIILPAA
jgi:hypothetical protein